MPRLTTQPSRPTHLNPLQFVSAGPAKLHEKAKEQLKQVERIKRVTSIDKPHTEELPEPDWQSVRNIFGHVCLPNEEYVMESMGKCVML